MAASNDGVAHPDTAVPSDVNTTTTSAKKPGEGSIGQENTLNFDPSPVRSNDFAPMAEEPDSSTPELDNAKASADVTKPTLGSPFLSPKLIAGDDKTVPSLEDGELIVTEPKDSIRMNSDLVEEQEEQSVEKAELKLGMPHPHHIRHQLTLWKASPLDKKESLVASTPEVHVEIKKEVDIDTEDSDIKPDTDVAIESRKVSKPAHSLPPHMRPDFRSPPSRLFGLQDSRASSSMNSWLHLKLTDPAGNGTKRSHSVQRYSSRTSLPLQFLRAPRRPRRSRTIRTHERPAHEN
jgi:hypothetical protein